MTLAALFEHEASYKTRQPLSLLRGARLFLEPMYITKLNKQTLERSWIPTSIQRDFSICTPRHLITIVIFQVNLLVVLNLQVTVLNSLFVKLLIY